MNVPLVPENIDSFYLEDELVLFSKESRHLYHLNGPAAFIWACFEEGYDSGEVISRLCSLYEINEETARRDMETAVSMWRDLGLMGEPQPQMEDRLDEEPGFPDLAGGEQVELPSSGEWLHRFYSLAGKVFEIRFTDQKLVNLIHPLFAHLEVTAVDSVDATVEVLRKHNGSFAIGHSGTLFAECGHENEVAPIVHANFLLAVYALGDSLVAFHAAVVCDGDNCVLMPGVSGSGKSTLTAAMIHAGFNYGTDEIALVTPETGDVYTVPLSIGLKEGAWDILSQRIPGLLELPIHLRADEKIVRYLSPGTGRISASAVKGTRVRLLVFPKFDRDSDTSARKMRPGETLCEISKAGYDMEGGLNSSRVSNLLAWVKGISSYELRYSDLSDAMVSIEKLLAQTTA